MSIVTNTLLDWKIFVFGFGLLASVSIINTKLPILPVSCFTFIFTSIVLWFTSMCVTFIYLHKLLQRNEPLDINIKFKSEEERRRQIKPNPERVEALTKDIDKYFISKWYVNISKDNDFTNESRQFIEEVISRLAEVQLSVDNKILLQGILNIYLKHFKEFRRSLKRKEKYTGSIEELYRYSHLCSANPKPKEYYIHQLTTNLLQHFINSELWNSSPCQVLVSILARRLIFYLLKLSSDPEILNYTLLNILASREVREKYNLESYSRVCINQYYDVVDSISKNNEEKGETENKDVDVVQNIETNNELGEKIVKLTVTPNVLTEGLHKKKRKKTLHKEIDIGEELKEEPAKNKQSTDSVTIFEPKSHRITKTWIDSKDLMLGISLGTDPLDSMPIENIKSSGKSTFWDPGLIDHYEDSTAHAANILLNEVKHTTHTTMEGLKSSIKPISDATVNTLHNIKDLQESTMNNALHKIGDFQDEAAGVMEGLLDFGRARLREGLRLTGLQDNTDTRAAPSQTVKPNLHPPLLIKKETKLTRTVSKDKLSIEDDTVWMNPLQMDSPNFDGQILLEKPMISEEKEKRDLQIPFISTELPDLEIIDSPDPEYEDTADLASSIAKLRSLLQQRSSESSLSTPALSPMPPDDFGSKPVEAECVSDLDEVDGVMPSFYKFCAKTATGVLDKTLNTIKTALPGNPQGTEQPDNAWIFIQQEHNEVDILIRMKKLLTERKDYCTLDNEIDTAYEAIDSLDTLQATFTSNVAFEDELDAFELKLPITKALLDIFCELLADTDSPFVQEPLVRAVLLSIGTALENFLIEKTDKIMEKLCTDLMMIPEKANVNTLLLEMDTYVESILTSLPDAVKVALGKSTLSKAINIFVSSLQSPKINQDVLLQIFELIIMKLVEESNQISPPASA